MPYVPPPRATRDPRRAPRPAPPRGVARLAALTPSAALRPEPTSAERVRLRRLVRAVLVGVIVVQSAALVLVLSPSARAQFGGVIVTNFVTGLTQGTTIRALNQNITNVFRTANEHLGIMRRSAEQNDRPYRSGSAYVNEEDLRQVTEIPLGNARITSGEHRAVDITDDNAVAYLTEVVPGTKRWDNYDENRRASMNMTLLTLRGGVQSLHDFNRSIQDVSRLREISEASRNAQSSRALQQLQIESSLEVARQLQALRAQQALQTNLYAVTESHKVGVEARQHAQDNATNCEVLAGMLPGASLLGLCSDS